MCSACHARLCVEAAAEEPECGAGKGRAGERVLPCKGKVTACRQPECKNTACEACRCRSEFVLCPRTRCVGSWRCNPCHARLCVDEVKLKCNARDARVRFRSEECSREFRQCREPGCKNVGCGTCRMGSPYWSCRTRGCTGPWQCEPCHARMCRRDGPAAVKLSGEKKADAPAEPAIWPSAPALLKMWLFRADRGEQVFSAEDIPIGTDTAFGLFFDRVSVIQSGRYKRGLFFMSLETTDAGKAILKGMGIPSDKYQGGFHVNLLTAWEWLKAHFRPPKDLEELVEHLLANPQLRCAKEAVHKGILDDLGISDPRLGLVRSIGHEWSALETILAHAMIEELTRR